MNVNKSKNSSKSITSSITPSKTTNKTPNKTGVSLNSSKNISSTDSISIEANIEPSFDQNQSITKNSSHSSEKENEKIKKIRMICKFIGNEEIAFLKTTDEDVAIEKIELVDNKRISTEWKFNFERVYDSTISFEELFENEIICNDNFSSFPENYKSSIIFLANSEETFTNINDDIFAFTIKSLNELFSIIKEKSNDSEDYFMSCSYLAINNSKITDKFEFNDNYLKIYDFGSETVVDKLREIRIKSTDEFENLMKHFKNEHIKHKNLANFSKGKQIKSENYNDNFNHEMITFKYYKNKNGNPEMKSKLNILMYKSYKLISEDQITYQNPEEYLLNTKENYNLFHTLKDCEINPNKVNFRHCIIARLIKDTILSDESFIVGVLPQRERYLILIHDLLECLRHRTVTIKLLGEIDGEEREIKNKDFILNYKNSKSQTKCREDSSNNTCSVNNTTNENHHTRKKSLVSNISGENKENIININNNNKSNIKSSKNLIPLSPICLKDQKSDTKNKSTKVIHNVNINNTINNNNNINTNNNIFGVYIKKSNILANQVSQSKDDYNKTISRINTNSNNNTHSNTKVPKVPQKDIQDKIQNKITPSIQNTLTNLTNSKLCCIPKNLYLILSKFEERIGNDNKSEEYIQKFNES